VAVVSTASTYTVWTLSVTASRPRAFAGVSIPGCFPVIFRTCLSGMLCWAVLQLHLTTRILTCYWSAVLMMCRADICGHSAVSSTVSESKTVASLQRGPLDFDDLHYRKGRKYNAWTAYGQCPWNSSGSSIMLVALDIMRAA
jgi:hypothetical protein